MSSREIVDQKHHVTGAALVDPEDPRGPCNAVTASCECGLPEPCCDHYCSINDCDWMIY